MTATMQAGPDEPVRSASAPALRAWIHDPAVHETVAAVRAMPGLDRRQAAPRPRVSAT